MLLRKKILVASIITLSIFLAGCGTKKDAPPMDRPAEDGNYYYKNADLKFSIVLPPEFIYYQTQRTENSGFIDIEFFIPTSDVSYPQEIQSYAKPIIMRVYEKDVWEEYNETRAEKKVFNQVGERGGKVYAVRMWDRIPDDWQERWSEDMKNGILENIKINN